jgi:nucleotide-binding universal stress UspA family protein
MSGSVLIAYDGSDDAKEAVRRAGARLASEAGLAAAPATAMAATNVWSTVLAEAKRHDAIAVVGGSRGRSPIKAAMLGSVSNGVASNSPVPVLVVRAAPVE